MQHRRTVAGLLLTAAMAVVLIVPALAGAEWDADFSFRMEPPEHSANADAAWVEVLREFDGKLIAGGQFDHMDGRPMPNIAASWNGVDDFGQPLAAGAYFVHLDAEGQRAVRKITVTR